ncbi:tyrosine--tRNA ligase [Candidatus Riesia pediculischaeffi]|uniref:Tyrosine--tRNA ligase n=1 Tax=Candidatus Riesia pediculischaeffi TaxID=428411 RepID=A0A1V0HL30_9ENTR|nr:tyrosine--tRNA ligase [Candidatus Riesia pediculischaeffi]ARC53431.1 hypothetical protein AOQ87_02085 [Candidatus Riesia pediculischaeffi]
MIKMQSSKKDFIKVLKSFKLIDQLIHEELLIQTIFRENITIYCGFDPTSDSLHVGHLVPLLLLRIFRNMGHRIIVLVGGATCLIGDPSFKDFYRTVNTASQIEDWTNELQKQIEKFLNFHYEKNDLIIVNNLTWLKDMKVMDFFDKIGKHFNVNSMIQRELVKNKIKNHVRRISFSEFSYGLLQAYDFYKLHLDYHVSLQIGGSDQWKNIIFGIELIRKLCNKKTFGLTFPLITNSNGKKFGKSKKNNIWLDPKKTSPYHFYQFWINIDDENARIFFYFLLISMYDVQSVDHMSKKYAEIINEKNKSSRSKIIQYFLADKITEMIHGGDNAKTAKEVSKKIFFYKDILRFKEQDFQKILKIGVQSVRLDSRREHDIREILVMSRISKSKKQAKDMISTNSISINCNPHRNRDYSISKEDAIFQRYSLIKKGKKEVLLVVWK